MEYTKICPECASVDISIPNAGLDIKMSIKDRCRDCGFIGNFPEVKINKIQEFNDNLRKHGKKTYEGK